MTRLLRLALSVLAGVLASTAAVGALPDSSGALSVDLTPKTIRLGFFSGNTGVHVSGLAAPGSSIVIVVRGPDVVETFNRKGRFGPVWLNAGKVEVSAVPQLFLSFSSAPLADLLRQDERDTHQVDLAALKVRMKLAPAAADQPAFRDDYMALKVEDGSYLVVENTVKLDARSEGAVSFALDVPWPEQGAPGSYTATVYECRDGRVATIVSAPFEVAEAGLAAAMQDLAAERGTLYGVIAILVTTSLGFGVDFLSAWLRRRRDGSLGRIVSTLTKKYLAVP